MADLEAIKERFDLLALVESDLGQGKKSGRWVSFSCPFPGHAHGDKNPSMRVTPDNGRYFCFTCGKTGDSITWLLEYRGMTWREIFDLAGADPGSLPSVPRPAPPPPQPDSPPAAAWLIRGLAFVEYCESQLWGDPGKEQKVYDVGGELLTPLEYLAWRGLKPETIRRYRLGYNPANLNDDPTAWGFDMAVWQEEHKDKPRPDRLWLPKGITIPWLVGGNLWAVNMRRPITGKGKYQKIPGSKAALFGADNLRGAELVLLTEGEFDSILAAQELGDVAGVATLGSATKRLDLVTWGAYLLPALAILAAYDIDPAGSAGLAALVGTSARVHPVTVPRLRADDKDLTDYYRAGGDLWAWFKWQLESAGVLAALGVPYDDNPGDPDPVPVALQAALLAGAVYADSQ